MLMPTTPLRLSISLHSAVGTLSTSSSSAPERIGSPRNSRSCSLGRLQSESEDTRRSLIGHQRLSQDRKRPVPLLAENLAERRAGVGSQGLLAEFPVRGSPASVQRARLSSKEVQEATSKAPRARVRVGALWHLPQQSQISAFCRTVVKHRYFQAVSLLSVIAALAMPDVWVLADRPDNAELDVLLTVVFVFFVLDLLMQTAASTHYPGSSVFWMDLLSAASLLLDVSYLPFFVAGETSSQTVLLTARLAKMGARACRLGRLVKVLRYLPSLAGRKGTRQEEGIVTVISGRFNQVLSTHISLLIIATVIVTPVVGIWTYPEEDWSLDSWMAILETIGRRNPEQLDEQLAEFHRFYSDMAYFPYHVVLRFANSVERVWEPPDVAVRGAPVRRWNSRRLATEHVECLFNIKVSNQREAAINMALMVLVLLLMVVSSLLLSKAVSDIIIRPLSRVLDRLLSTSRTIFNSVSMMADTVEAAKAGEDVVQSSMSMVHTASLSPLKRGTSMSSKGEAITELEMLQLDNIMAKLSIVARFLLASKDNKAELEEIDAEHRPMFAVYAADYREEPLTIRRAKSVNFETHLRGLQLVGLSLEVLDSWDLNPLALDKPRTHAACLFFLSQPSHGVHVDHAQLQSFLGAVEGTYNNVPYHNWFHAVDVTHSMYRFLKIFRCNMYMPSADRYALLVSAVAHDCGHPGLTNHFLVETSHELALRYNDASPLENMHCQRLFEILATPRSNVLQGLTLRQSREVRKVCLEAILHTDMTAHFQMIKELELFYGMNSELQEAFQFCTVDPEAFLSDETLACYSAQETQPLLWRLFLHLCDLSNPTKPFRICRVWAHRCLDEFFLQGDAELAAGLPVQSLHDRSKVNREHSQIGFIEFLLAPLAFSAMKVLPPYAPCAEQLVDNVRQWQDAWVTASRPPAEEQAAVEARLKRLEQRFFEP